MITQSQTWKDAESIASDALLEMGDPRLGARLQMATERVAGVLLEHSWRARNETEYVRWRNCVHRAAIEMARYGQLPGGARLSMWADRLFVGW